MLLLEDTSRSANSASLRLIFFSVLVIAFPRAVYAQRTNQGDRQVPPAVQACAGCHGTRGEGNPDAGSPRIAGQSAYYLLKQLDSYANGSRRDRVMEPIARGLPPELRADVAAHYASLDAPFDERARSQRPSERGRVLANDGDNALGVPACRNCHGPGGVGEPPNIPYIGGLDAAYHTAELTAWKQGTRTNDAGQQMFRIAAALSAEDISAVAQYYASLTPPKPAPLNLLQAPSPKKTALGTTPTTQPEGQRERSVGIEQGAPMRGGTHGKGAADISRDAPKGGSKGGGEPGASKGTPKTDGADASKAGPKTSGTQWPRLSDAAKAETSPLSSDPSVGVGDPARGRAIIATGVHGCAACHTIPGIRFPAGIVGPPLGGLAQRRFIAGQLPNRTDVLVAFLQNPPALVPQTGMPDVGLTAEQARHIAAYLYTLEASGAQ
jgi:cytochrome c553/cytochrome c2